MLCSRAQKEVMCNSIQQQEVQNGGGQMQRLITLNEAAQQLGISVAAVRDWRFRRKHLDFVKVGRAVRVIQSSIDKFIENQTVPAGKER